MRACISLFVIPATPQAESGIRFLRSGKMRDSGVRWDDALVDAVSCCR